MGKKHREKRTLVKKTIRQLGVRENEFGELQKVGTKAEARHRLLRSKRARHEIEVQITFIICEKAREEIQAQEDAHVFGTFSQGATP